MAVTCTHCSYKLLKCRDPEHTVCLVWFPQAHHYGCGRTLPAHLRWIQKADYQITNCSSPPCGPSCPPSLEQALGQSAAQGHRSLGGQFGNSLVPFQYWQKIHTKLYTLRNPGKGREHWEHSTRQAAGASAFGFPKERRRRRRERFHIIRLEWKPQGRKMHSDFFFPKVEEEPKSEWAASRKIRFLCFTIRSPDCCFSIIMWIPGASCSYTPLKHWGLPFSC